MRAEGYGGVVRALVVFVFVIASCGRSADPLVPCPQPDDDCEKLVEQQQDVEAVFAAAGDDADVREEAAQCVQLFVEVSLDRQCVAGCDELCRLHPCAIVDDDGNRFDPSTCPDRCAALEEEGAIDDAALDIAAVNAAENPGFCTCRACTAADDALCTRLFDCAIE